MFTYYGKSQASMLLGDFKHKLKRLNENLYIADEARVMDGLKHSGIYLKGVRQRGLSWDTKGQGTSKQEKYYAALESGELDKYMCGVCIEWLPEFDVYNAEYTRIAVPGWRTTLLRLIQSKVVTLDKARKIFECQALGESDYDNMTFFNKLQFAKKIDRIE